MLTQDEINAKKARYVEVQDGIKGYLGEEKPTKDDTDKYMKLVEEGNELQALFDGMDLIDRDRKGLNGTLSLGPAGSVKFTPNDVDETSFVNGIPGNVYAHITTNSYKADFMKYFRNRGRVDSVHGNALKNLQEGIKIAQEGLDAEGGFLVPPEFVNVPVIKKPMISRVQDRVRKFNTSSNMIKMPKVNWTTDDNYTNPIRVTNAGEVPPTSTTIAQPTPQWDQVTIPVQTWMGSIPLSNDLLDDNSVDVMSIYAMFFQQASRIRKEYSILFGTGSNDNIGIVALAKASGGIGGLPQGRRILIDHTVTNSFADTIASAQYNVPAQYEDEPMEWVLNRTNTMAYISTLKSTTDQYLFATGWQDNGLAARRPTLLAGDPFIECNFMENATSSGSLAVGNHPFIFGILNGYYLVERAAMSLKVLDQPLATENQVQIVTRNRFGGMPVEEWKLYTGEID